MPTDRQIQTEFDVTELAVGSIVFCFAGLVQGCTGFGMALVAAPCLMLTLPPTVAVPTIILLSGLNTLLVALEGRRHINPRLVGPLALGGAVGIRVGIYALEVVNPTVLKAFVGVFVFGFALVLLAGWRKPLEDPKWALIPVGLAGGFLGGSTSMGGPPVILFLASQNTPKDIFRGNIACYFFVTNCFGIGMMLMRGLITGHIVGRAAVYVPFTLLGTYLGVKLARRVPEEMFRMAVMVGLAIMGLVLFVSNIRGVV